MERKIDLSEAPISIDPYFQFLQDPKAGGICLFIGTIRNKNLGKSVQKLSMEAYPPMALKQIERLTDQAAAQWPIQK